MADRHQRLIPIALIAGFILGAICMRGYSSLNLKLRERFSTYLQYGPLMTRIDCPEVAPSPILRFESATVVVGDKLYVLGGFDTEDLRATTRADIYVPADNAWKRIADLPTPVTHAGIAVDGDTIWLAGGFVGNHPGKATDAVWRYDVKSDRWHAAPPLPEPRASAPLVRSNRSLHYFGGLKSDRRTDSPDHWRLDLDSANAWTVSAALPDARNHLGGIEFGGKIYAIGGQHGHDIASVDVAPVHAYDPASDTWQARASLPFGRSHFEPGTFKAGGEIIIVGGRANERRVLDDVTAYDPATNVWRDLVPLDTPLRAPTAAMVGGRVLIGLGGTLPKGTKPRATLRACELRELGLEHGA